MDKGVSQTVVGMIFGASPVGSFLLSFVFGKRMMQIGRKRLMALGICMEATAVFTFGFIDFLTDTNLYIAISYASRLLMGIGLTGFGTASYAFAAAHYPDQLMGKIAMIELFAGLGLMAGPIFGALVYAIGGYVSVFLTLGSLFFALVPYLWKNIPADEPYEPPKHQISYFSLLKIRKLLLTFLVPTFTIAGIASIEPTLQPHLLQYGLSHEVAAACFIIGTFSYSMVMPVVNKFPAHWDKRIIINIGMLLAAVCQFLLGPTPGLLPPKLWITILGLFIQGYGCAITLIPAMPEMLKAAAPHFPHSKDDLSDRISGLLSAGFALGNLVGPQVGGYLADHYGFPWGATVIGIGTFGYLIILLTLGGGFCAFRTCFKANVEEDVYVEASEGLSTSLSKKGDDSGIEFQDADAFSRKSTYASISTENP
jgi:MFS family permease